MDDSFGQGVGAKEIASGSSNDLAVTDSGAKLESYREITFWSYLYIYQDRSFEIDGFLYYISIYRNSNIIK